MSFACLFERVERLVGFFQEHRRQSGVSLFPVPGTTVRRSQAVHQYDKIVECFRHRVDCPESSEGVQVELKRSLSAGSADVSSATSGKSVFFLRTQRSLRNQALLNTQSLGFSHKPALTGLSSIEAIALV